MALVTKRIYRISGNHSALNAQQIGVESSADADLGFKMYGGKDDAGNITKFLAKGKPGIMSTLNLSGGSTTGDAGILKHDTLGDITGGQMTVSEFNTYISDGGFLWTRDTPNTRLEPLTASDKIVVGDGTVATPGVAHESNPTSGMYYGDIGHSINGIGLAHGAAAMIGVGVDSGIAVMVCDPGQIGFEIRHQRDNATGANEMKIHNVSTQSGVTSSLTIEASAVSAVSEIVLDAENLELNAYSAIDLTADLGTITIQAKGTTLGGVIIESDWFEFQNYTAYDPIPVWNSNAQWAAYEAEFGTEYPILQAIVDNASGGGGGTLDDAYDFGGAGSGRSITADSGAVMITATGNNALNLVQNNSETNWYDTDAQAVYLSGTATQGMVISSAKDIVIGINDTTTETTRTLDLISRTTGEGTQANASIQAIALGADGTAQPDANALVYAYSEKTDATAELKAQAGTTLNVDTNARMIVDDATTISELTLRRFASSGRLTLTNVNYLDLNGTEIRDIKNTSYTPYTITVTSDAFDFDPDNGCEQYAVIDADSTWEITDAPANGSSKTLLKVRSSGGDWTLTLIGTTDSTVQWVGTTGADGVSIPSGECAILAIFYDSTTGWVVSQAVCVREDFNV